MSSSSLAPEATKPISLRWIFQHMIEEYARHNGHADLLRERIDGSTSGRTGGRHSDSSIDSNLILHRPDEAVPDRQESCGRTTAPAAWPELIRK
jgi:hypothetical protein